jgi:regulatory protein
MLCSGMRSNPRKLSTEADIYNSSLRALMRRAHSVHEMKEYLNRRAENADLVSSVLARLREHKYLDDARYALDYARGHAKSRRQGRFRIARDLRARGVPDKHVEAALETVFAETDEASLIRARLKRRLANIRGPLDQRKIASIYRSLLAAGFSSDAIRSELRVAVTDAKAAAQDALDVPIEPETDELAPAETSSENDVE